MCFNVLGSSLTVFLRLLSSNTARLLPSVSSHVTVTAPTSSSPPGHIHHRYSRHFPQKWTGYNPLVATFWILRIINHPQLMLNVY